MVLNYFAAPRDIWHSLETFFIVTAGDRGAAGNYYRVRDAAEIPTMYRTAPTPHIISLQQRVIWLKMSVELRVINPEV